MSRCCDSIINSKIFANYFLQMCRDYSPQLKNTNVQFSLQKYKFNSDILQFLSQLRNAMLWGKCDDKNFKEQILKINNIKFFTVEIWWYLYKCDIVRQEDFFVLFSSEDYWYIAEHFSMCLFKNIFNDSQLKSNLKNKISSDLLECLLKHKEKCDVNGTRSLVFSNFMKLIPLCIVSGGNENESLYISTLVNILKMTSIKISEVKLFLLSAIEMLMQGKQIALEEIIGISQNYLVNEKLLKSKNYEEALKLFNTDEVVSFLKQMLVKNSKTLCLKNFLPFLSEIILFYDDIHKQFKTIIQFLLGEALQNENERLLLYVFILARHCSFPHVTCFPTYLQWFSSTFSSDSLRPINTKKKALFFLNFMSEIVKFDSPYYLKVHINRIPYLPIDCQTFLSDYVKLVKTRLIDLNEPVELGLFENINGHSSAEFDVDTALAIFSKTNSVPNCILEASLFCKSYYEKKFLVELLSKFQGENSVRHNLIMKLHKLGKVPNSMLLNYKKMT